MRRAGVAALAAACVGAGAPAWGHELAVAPPALPAFTDPFQGRAADNTGPAVYGQFSAPFTEPTIRRT